MSSIKKDTVKGGQVSSAKKQLHTGAARSRERGSQWKIHPQVFESLVKMRILNVL